MLCHAERQLLMQTEELLMKRRTLLEKKCAQEAERAREQMKAKNKRGKSLHVFCLHAL